MGTVQSDSEGSFQVHGSETEISDIDMRLSIYHNCEDETTVSHTLINVRLFLIENLQGMDSK